MVDVSPRRSCIPRPAFSWLDRGLLSEVIASALHSIVHKILVPSSSENVGRRRLVRRGGDGLPVVIDAIESNRMLIRHVSHASDSGVKRKSPDYPTLLVKYPETHWTPRDPYANTSSSILDDTAVMKPCYHDQWQGQMIAKQISRQCLVACLGNIFRPTKMQVIRL